MDAMSGFGSQAKNHGSMMRANSVTNDREPTSTGATWRAARHL